MTLVERSPAKLNLFLNILGRRADGYHELETILHPLAVWDYLHFETRPAGIELSCDDARLPVDDRNLVYRAARRFFEVTGLRGGIRIHLEKRIPHGAGLGGGSGNAATTLRILNECYGRPLDSDWLQKLAAELGADVPFFLWSRPALALGRGDCLRPLDWFAAFEGCAFVVVYPGFGIATPWAYAQMIRFPSGLQGRPGRAQAALAAFQGTDPCLAAAEFFNALELPAFEKYPVLELYQEFFMEQGALGARMTGSGSAVFALARNLATAQRMEAAWKEQFGYQLWTAVVPVRPTSDMP
ncbi:MAG: 4-(cytidine 5'-diphospho)-2-C-methyl-D-erythritol kinase [Verrucomicrobiota bacterium]|nr:4-(cytidine 5'-diphospho)-2-C-methyl-D-erythritol kinase [Limisphaera sp.]MDW8382735.1 4-(cytidine 5'-diphospho)-2-C-methyl-D-erythritol kinase [Verrucomicrobiota bacterium]